MAERRLTDPAGTDFKPDRSRWQDASVFAQRNWLGALVLLLAILSAVLTIKLGTDQAQQQRDTLYDNRLTLNQSCVRGNDARVAQIDDILDTRAGNLARAHAWHSLIEQGTLPRPILRFAHEQERANRSEAKDKIANATAIVLAQAPVAAHPHAKDLIRRAEVACDAVYPLPADRGDELPEPTLP